MKKLLLPCLMLVFISSAKWTLAVETDSTSVMRQKTEEKRTVVQEKRQELSAKRGDKLAAHCDLVETRLLALLGKIKLRMEERKKVGNDNGAMDKLVTEIETTISTGSGYCDNAVAKFDSVPVGDWTTQKTVMVEGRKLAEHARLEYVKAHKSLARLLYELARTRKEVK